MSQIDPSQPSVQTQTEWQQSPQYAPQQSAFQQPFQPQPPKKKSRKGLWITIGVIIVIIAIISAASGHNGSQPSVSSTPSHSSGNQQQSTQAANQPTAQPTIAANEIGKAVVVDSTWTVTVNSAKTNTGDSIFAPKSNNIYIVVDATVKNTSSSSQTVSSIIQFNFKDSTGQQYDETVTDFGKPPDGNITTGGVLRGQLIYEVPISQHTFTFSFQSDLGGTDLTEWTLKV